MLNIKLIIVGVILCALGGLGWYGYNTYNGLKKDLAEVSRDLQQVTEDRDRVVRINKDNAKALKNLQDDLDFAKKQTKALEEKAKKEAAQTAKTIKDIKEAVAKDPETNTRPISPAIEIAIDAMKKRNTK